MQLGGGREYSNQIIVTGLVAAQHSAKEYHLGRILAARSVKGNGIHQVSVTNVEHLPG